MPGRGGGGSGGRGVSQWGGGGLEPPLEAVLLAINADRPLWILSNCEGRPL